jgi:predicted nucleotidyltransferase
MRGWCWADRANLRRMSAAAYPYPSYPELQARRLAERRRQALAAVRAAAAAVAPLGVTLRVFGSLAEGRFHEASDLDLALDGPEPVLGEAEALVWDAAAAEGFTVDLVRLGRASASLAERIGTHGCAPADLA